MRPVSPLGLKPLECHAVTSPNGGRSVTLLQLKTSSATADYNSKFVTIVFLILGPFMAHGLKLKMLELFLILTARAKHLGGLYRPNILLCPKTWWLYHLSTAL